MPMEVLSYHYVLSIRQWESQVGKPANVSPVSSGYLFRAFTKSKKEQGALGMVGIEIVTSKKRLLRRRLFV